MIKSVNYPIYIDLANNNGAMYTVTLDGKLIFTGKSVIRTIDLAPLIKNYLNSQRIIIDYPDNDGLNNLTIQPSAGIIGMTVNTSTNPVDIQLYLNDAPPTSTSVIYIANDFNEDCKTDFPDDTYITSKFIRNEVDPRQIIFLGANTGLNELNYSIQTDGTYSIEVSDISVGMNLRGAIINFENQDKLPLITPVDDWYLNFEDGSYIIAYYDGGAGSDPEISSVFSDIYTIIYLQSTGWLQKQIIVPNDKDYIVISNSLPAHSGNYWGFDYAITNIPNSTINSDIYQNHSIIGRFTINDSDINTIIFSTAKNKISDIIQGDNLRGITVKLLNQNLSPNGNGELTFTDNIGIYQNGKYITDYLELGIGNITTDTGMWLMSEFTFPNDRDLIVASNTLPIGNSRLWGWDYSTYDTEDNESLKIKVLPCYKYRYVLYAVNRLGGIIHLVCEGKPLESHTKTNWDIETNYDRLSEVARGVKRMAVMTVRKWRINTGYLTDSESAMINDLVTSPKIVLHDLEENRLFAVNSENNSIDTKTKKSNGARLIEYTLNFEEARLETRR